MKNLIIIAIAAIPLWISSCMVVRPGEVGFIQTSGKLSQPIRNGLKAYSPFVSKQVKINGRIVDVYEELQVPSKEGLSVNAEISLLYHVDAERAKDIYYQFGRDYQNVVIISNLRATAREICAKYEVKQLYSTERQKIEQAILDQMKDHISKYGFIIDAVLLRDIVMPKEISASIDRKVEAEQAALTMDFVIAKQKKEAERVIIEAEGIKTSQEIINKAISPQALQYRYIETLKTIGTSPNAKTILLDKQAPVFLNVEK